MGLFLRSLAYNALFYLAISIQLVFWTPAFFLVSRADGWKIVRLWGWLNLWLQHKIIGSTFDFRGLENLPKGGGYIVAAKHQSTWETFTILLFLSDPSFIIKRELMFVPLFGWYAVKMRLVAVDRGRGGRALASMTEGARRELAAGRQLVIFPEGTRTTPYAPPRYKYGIVHLAEKLQVPVVPMALNSGLFWPRHSFLRYPGRITQEFLPAIGPGLPTGEFERRLERELEAATSAAMESTRKQVPPPPLVERFSKRSTTRSA